jgi:glutaredoxin 3
VYEREDSMDATLRKTAQIRLFTGAYCPYCRMVKRELERLELNYESVNADADGREQVICLSGQRAIPILTIDDEVFVDSSHIVRELRRRYA